MMVKPDTISHYQLTAISHIPYTSPSNNPYQSTFCMHYWPLACLTGYLLHLLINPIPAIDDP